MARQMREMAVTGKELRPVMIGALGGVARLFMGFVLCSVGDVTLGISDVAMAMSEASRAGSSDALSNDTFAAVSTTAQTAVVNIFSTRKVKKEEKAVESNQNPLLDDPSFRQSFGDQFPEPFQTPRPRREQAQGSGVIVSPEGYIVTNNYVVEGADQIKVLLVDKRRFEATVIGTDPKTDVAVIKINAANLPTLSWGDPRKLQVGERVLAIGRPFGLSQIVDIGIISAVGPSHIRVVDYMDFSQKEDAAINPGNSGGALVNLDGELIGINTAIYSQSSGYMGDWFAIPSDMVKSVMNSLAKHGKVIRGWLGVSTQDLNEDLAKEFGAPNTKGALVDDVAANSPADKAGLQRGDIIIALNDVAVEDPGRLLMLATERPPGTTVALSVWRDKDTRQFTVTLGESPNALRSGSKKSDENDQRENALTGVAVEPLTSEEARRLHVSSGVVVVEVAPNSPAERAGIRPDDGILELNRKPIQSVLDFERLVRALPPESRVLLLVTRGRGTIFRSVGPE